MAGVSPTDAVLVGHEGEDVNAAKEAAWALSTTFRTYLRSQKPDQYDLVAAVADNVPEELIDATFGEGTFNEVSFSAGFTAHAFPREASEVPEDIRKELRDAQRIAQVSELSSMAGMDFAAASIAQTKYGLTGMPVATLGNFSRSVAIGQVVEQIEQGTISVEEGRAQIGAQPRA